VVGFLGYAAYKDKNDGSGDAIESYDSVLEEE
jgi:hypothetical protein